MWNVLNNIFFIVLLIKYVFGRLMNMFNSPLHFLSSYKPKQVILIQNIPIKLNLHIFETNSTSNPKYTYQFLAKSSIHPFH